jgi:3-oxoacyl-[acyl-carrier protein] reductase
MSKVSFVTGAGGYIGGAIARTLAARGDKVAVCDINESAIDNVVNEILKEGGEACGMVVDVSDSDAVDNAIEKTVIKYGRLDIAVHAAGGSAKIAGDSAEYHVLADQEDFVIDRVFKVNLYGSMFVGRAAAKQFRLQKDVGHIVFISSAIGLNGFNGKSEYAAAKGGVIALAKSLAKELGMYQVTVNTVAPGAVGNVWVKDEHFYNNNFLHIRGNAQDIANAVEFLASDKARFITGQTIVVDGGRSLALKGTD